jgi:vacuolar-type H+-ATPase subunit H
MGRESQSADGGSAPKRARLNGKQNPPPGQDLPEEAAAPGEVAKVTETEVAPPKTPQQRAQKKRDQDALAYQLRKNPDQLKEYKALSKEQKDDFLKQFKLDKSQCSKVAKEETTRGSSSSTQSTENYWTVGQLQNLGGFSAEEVEALIQDLPSQPSRFPSLAKKGVLEYHYIFETTMEKNFKDKNVTVQASTEDIDDEDFEKIQKAMGGSPGPSKRPKAKAKPQPLKDVEECEKVERQFSKLVENARKKYYQEQKDAEEWKMPMLSKWKGAVDTLQQEFTKYQEKIVQGDKEEAVQEAKVIMQAFCDGIKAKFKW